MDHEFESMVKQFCKAANLDKFKDDSEKKETLEKLVEPIHEYETKRVMETHGELKMTGKYQIELNKFKKEIAAPEKVTWDQDELKWFVGRIKKCYKGGVGGGTFIVSQVTLF